MNIKKNFYRIGRRNGIVIYNKTIFLAYKDSAILELIFFITQ